MEKLNTLTFRNCPQLSQPDFKLMSSLKSLTIDNCSKFTCQPEDLPNELNNLSFVSQNFSTYDLEKLVNRFKLYSS